MADSTLLVGYEINAQLAKDKLQKSKGLMNRLKKTHSSEVVSHVTNAWNELESILKSEGYHCENKVLYTAQLSAFSEVKSNATTIVNNSFLLSIITADEDSKFEAVQNERYVAYSKASEFEQKQFSIYLSEIESNFESQEVGVFGWLRIPTDDLAKIQKRVASGFPTNTGGELHFFEFHKDGSIFPNFADVSTQRLEGKLAGNYALKFDAQSCQRGISDLNEITEQLFNLKVVEAYGSLPALRTDKQEVANQKIAAATNKKKSYSEEFKLKVVEASLAEGQTLKAVAEVFGISATLVSNWKKKYSPDTNKLDRNMSEENSNITFVWHIDRAKFSFEDQEEYLAWQANKSVFFEIDPSASDDGGEDIFENPEDAATEFEVNAENGKVSISLEEDGPIISAWVQWSPNLAEGIGEDEVVEWGQDMAGWESGSIYLGDVDASIVEDDGGDIRVLE